MPLVFTNKDKSSVSSKLCNAVPCLNSKPNTLNLEQRKQKPANNQTHPATRRQPRSSASRRGSTSRRRRRRRRRRHNQARRSSSDLLPKHSLRLAASSQRRSVYRKHTRRNLARGQGLGLECQSLGARGGETGVVAERHRVADGRYGSGACVGRGVSVGLVVVDDAVGEDRVKRVRAVGLCGTAGGVGLVADYGDAGCAPWEDCGACSA